MIWHCIQWGIFVVMALLFSKYTTLPHEISLLIALGVFCALLASDIIDAIEEAKP